MEFSPAIAKILADFIVLFHFSFVIFVLFGALLLLKWRKLIWVHIPCLIWGVLVELNGWYCPLTPLENEMRRQAGLEMYNGDFVMQYLMPILYPQDLTRAFQIFFGMLLLTLNLVVYGWLLRRRREINAGS